MVTEKFISIYVSSSNVHVTFFDKGMSKLHQNHAFLKKRNVLHFIILLLFYTFVLLAMKFNQSGVKSLKGGTIQMVLFIKPWFWGKTKLSYVLRMQKSKGKLMNDHFSLKVTKKALIMPNVLGWNKMCKKTVLIWKPSISLVLNYVK